MPRPCIPFLALAVLFATAALGSDDAVDAKAVTKVSTRDVVLKGDTVSGVVVNNSPHTVRDVQLQIIYVWMWNNERHPGSNNPGHTDYYTLPGEIPAVTDPHGVSFRAQFFTDLNALDVVFKGLAPHRVICMGEAAELVGKLLTRLVLKCIRVHGVEA